jgi:membrane protein
MAKRRDVAVAASDAGGSALRVWRHFGSHDGRLLAAGLAYQAIFSLLAGIWFTFSLLGVLFQGNPAVEYTLVQGVNYLVPHLIGESGSIIQVSALMHSGTLGISSLLSLIALLYTTTGFINALRGGLRQMFDLPANERSSGAQAIRDMPYVIGFGLLLLLTAIISVKVGAVQEWLFDMSGLMQPGWYILVVPPVIAFLIVSGLAMVLLTGFIRLVAGVRLPWRRHVRVVLLAGIILGLLQTLISGFLLAPKDNALLASFAVVFGLLIYFNLVCEILLYCAAWLRITEPAAQEA